MRSFSATSVAMGLRTGWVVFKLAHGGFMPACRAALGRRAWRLGRVSSFGMEAAMRCMASTSCRYSSGSKLALKPSLFFDQNSLKAGGSRW